MARGRRNRHRARMGIGGGAWLAAAGLTFVMGWLAMPGAAAQGDPDVLWTAGNLGGEVGSAAFTPGGRTLASATSDGVARLWRVADGRLLHTLTAHTDAVASVVFSPSGLTLASGSHDGTIILWRVSDGQRLQTISVAVPVHSVAYSPDGQTLASGCADDTIKLWRVSDGELLDTLAGHTGSVNSVAFSPDGTTLASGSDDRKVKLWRVADGELLRTLVGHANEVHCVAFSPDGETLASAGAHTTVRFWRVSDGQLIRTLTVPANTVAFAPDGQALVSVGPDPIIRFWRISDGALLQYYKGAAGEEVLSVAYSPDGGLFTYGRRDAALVVAYTPGDHEWAAAPEGWFVPGWVWFSIPLRPHASEASVILGFDAVNRLFAWDDAAKTVLLYPDDFSDLAVGPSYLARLDLGEAYAPTYPGTQPVLPFESTLAAAGWCWVGVPGTADIYGLDLSVIKDGVLRTPGEDRDAADPWLNWNWIFWDPEAQSAGIMDPFGAGDDEWLHPWWGYRVWSNTGDLTLVFP